MPTKKCCCCPDCTERPGKCCRCIPRRICITITPYAQDPCSGELEWDRTEKRFQGTICNHDILLYFERDQYRDACYFKLRSDSLGFPEDYEHEWEVGYEIDCDTLTASVDTDEGLVEIVAVDLVTPTECTGCRCLCECLCVTLTEVVDEVTTTCVGKLCWDYTQHAYVGTVVCDDEYETEREVTITLGRKGDYCDDEYPGTEYDDCDPYDETCVFVANVPDLSIENAWIELEGCQGSAITGTFDIAGPGPYDSTTIEFRCAECNENCGGIRNCCCGNVDLSQTMVADDGMGNTLQIDFDGDNWCGDASDVFGGCTGPFGEPVNLGRICLICVNAEGLCEWFLRVGSVNYTAGGGTTCDPFEASFTGDFCGTGSSFTITVTE